jgi:hypothetical protein
MHKEYINLLAFLIKYKGLYLWLYLFIVQWFYTKNVGKKKRESINTKTKEGPLLTNDDVD